MTSSADSQPCHLQGWSPGGQQSSLFARSVLMTRCSCCSVFLKLFPTSVTAPDCISSGLVPSYWKILRIQTGTTCLLHCTVPFVKSMGDKAGRLPFCWQISMWRCSNCLNCTSDHTTAFSVSHRPQLLISLIYQRVSSEGGSAPLIQLGCRNWSCDAALQANMLHELHKLIQQTMNVSYMLVPWDSSVIQEISSGLFSHHA